MVQTVLQTLNDGTPTHFGGN